MQAARVGPCPVCGSPPVRPPPRGRRAGGPLPGAVLPGRGAGAVGLRLLGVLKPLVQGVGGYNHGHGTRSILHAGSHGGH